MALETAQDLPLPPGDPPASLGETAGLSRLRGTLFGYDSSTTRAPFAYGLIRADDGELHFFARAHLERGVIAELLQPGAPLEFFSQKSEPDIHWAFGVRKPNVMGIGWARRRSEASGQTSKIAKTIKMPQSKSRSPKRTLRRRWVSLLDYVVADDVVVSDDGTPGEAQSSKPAVHPAVPSSKRWISLCSSVDSSVVVEPELEPTMLDVGEVDCSREVTLDELLSRLLQVQYNGEMWTKALEVFHGYPFGAFLDDELEKVNRKILQRMEALAITGALPQASWHGISITKYIFINIYI
ncbi:unnamed protein product [Durusdinium trenchii]|uniref:Uncharacterized protein n=1 Tax=Durusdinium trenchii TaxID=1381693 RepID=A0ABP0NHL8_9DINO